MPALLCIAYTALLIGAAWWISRKLGNAGEDTSCDDPYVDSLVREVRTGSSNGSLGGRGCTEQNFPSDTHTQDVYTRHENSRLTRVRTDFRRRFPFWDTSL